MFFINFVVNYDSFGLPSSTNQLSIACSKSTIGSDLSLMHTRNSSTNSTLKRRRPNSNGTVMKNLTNLYLSDVFIVFFYNSF